MNNLYQKYKQVIEPIIQAIFMYPTNSCNAKKTITQDKKADGLVFNIIKLYHKKQP